MPTKKWIEENREKLRAYQREYMKKWRSSANPNHKANNRKSNKARKDRAKNFFLDIRKNSQCKFCGENCEHCLDFHHLDPATKVEAVGTMVAQARSLKQIKEEIAKCIVLCSNCHRKLHAGVIQL